MRYPSRTKYSMKILHVIDSLDPKRGGPAESVRQLTAACLVKGQHSEIVSLDDPKAVYLQDFPARVHPLGRAKLNYSYSTKLAPWLEKNAASYDLVVVHGIWQYHSYAVWRALRQSITPYVVYTHGMLSPWFKRTYPLKHLKKWLYWPWGVYPVLRDANATLFTCEEERLQARESFWLYKCHEVVAYCGTAGSEGDPDAELDAFYQRYPALRQKRLLVFMSRLHPIKGCDLLIEAFARTLKQDPEWHLVIAGPDQTGRQEALLKAGERLGISERITWAGMLKGDEKWGALRAADAFVLPSHHENFGVVVAEALSCGTPVLISNQINIWREIKNDGAAIVDDDTFQGTSRLLTQWKNTSEERRTAMRSNARRCYQENFDIHLVANRFIDILASITGTKN